MLVTWSCLNVQSTWERAKTKSRKNTWMNFNVPRNSVQCTQGWKTSKVQTWRAVCDPRTTHASIFIFYRKPLLSSFHTSFHCTASILGVTSLTCFHRSGQCTSYWPMDAKLAEDHHGASFSHGLICCLQYMDAIHSKLSCCKISTFDSLQFDRIWPVVLAQICENWSFTLFSGSAYSAWLETNWILAWQEATSFDAMSFRIKE